MSINSSRRTGKDHLTKPPTAQTQLARLKREEEEELWISGEELCTEGSSDEEDSKTPSRTYRTNKTQETRNSSSPGGGKHHWIVSDSTRNPMDRYKDEKMETNARTMMNSNSEENSLSSSEIGNTSSVVDSPNIRSNSSVQSDTNVSLITDETCSDVAQDEEQEVEERVGEDEEEGQGLKDSEISWKVNRESRSMNLPWQEDVAELNELTQVDYQQEFDLIARLRDKLRVDEDTVKNENEFLPRSLDNSEVLLQEVDNEENGTYLRNDVNEAESRVSLASEDDLRKQISKVESLDAVIQKFDNNVEEEMKETSLCQYKNRERLKEMLSNRPLETGRLAENTRRFFNLYNECANVPAFTNATSGKMKRNDSSRISSPSDRSVSTEEKTSTVMDTQDQCTNEELSAIKRQRANKFSKEKKTLVTCRTTISPIATPEQRRIAMLLQDTQLDSDDGSITYTNPFCVNDDERKSLSDLKEKLSALKAHYVQKNSKASETQVTGKISTNTCNISASVSKTAIPTISTVSTISTLQSVDEAILKELMEDSKMVAASFDKRRQIMPFPKET